MTAPKTSFRSGYASSPLSSVQNALGNNNIIVGRVIVAGVALFIAFLFGWMIGSLGSSGVSDASYKKVKDEKADIEKQLEDTQSDLTQVRNENNRLRATPTTVAGETTADGTTATTVPGSASATTIPGSATTKGKSQSYKVVKGDTWASISLKFYGTPNYQATIANANGHKKADAPTPGETLTIPPKPGTSSTPTTKSSSGTTTTKASTTTTTKAG